MTVTTSISSTLEPRRTDTPTDRDEMRLVGELHRALAELAEAEDAERRRQGAPELLEARSLRAANAVIGARLALHRLHACLAGAFSPHDQERVAADLAVLALAPRGTSPASSPPGHALPIRGHGRR